MNCNRNDSKKESNESVLKGVATVLVDETLTPIIEDQVTIFESKYDAKINIVSKSEAEIMVSLFKSQTGIAILSRMLTQKENKFFQQNKINPKITKFAMDAIALISNKSSKDTLIELKSVIQFIQKGKSNKIKGLVFDNPNSSTVRYFKDISGSNDLPTDGIYSFKTNQEVIDFVSKNEGMIGVVGINWLFQPNPSIQNAVNNINILSVKSLTRNEYISPSQNNIAEGKYPLARELYIINAQGYPGLGMGFSSFIAGDIGQRIILKSGLLPVYMPGRKLIIRSKINQTKN